MFGFLFPGAMAGLALLTVPILLHIFKPRKVRQTPFSSLRFLRASQHRLSRRIRWHQVILFLLRAALVCLLVLALAKPIFSSGAAGGNARRFVILDVTQSMGYRARGAEAPIDAGKRVAEQLVSQVVAGDMTTVILAGSSPRALGPLTADAGAYLPDLRAAALEPVEGRISDALRLVAPMVQAAGQSDATVELHFITDNHVRKWSQAGVARFLSQIKVPVHVNVVQVGGDLAQNAALTDVRLVESQEPRRRTIRVQAAAVGAEAQTRTVRLTGLEGLPDVEESVRISPGRPSTVEFNLSPDEDLKGRVAEVRLEPEDAFAGDDRLWLNLDATGALRVLVVEPESTQVRELQPGLHLRTALQALAYATPGSVQTVKRAPTQILKPEIESADVVFLVDVPRLSAGDVEALAQRVRQGAGLVVFLGSGIDVSFYNSALYDPLRPSESLLATQIQERVRVGGGTGPAGGLARVAQVQWSHPVFARLFDPIYGDLGQLRFESFHRLQVLDAGGGAQVLATVGRETPAIVERNLGLGKVVLFNATANDEWSDLPRLKSFVPLVDRLLNYLAGGSRRSTFTVGEVATLPLPDAAEDPRPTVRSPSGKAVGATLRPIAGRAAIQADNLSEVGVYRVQYEGRTARLAYPFVVQPMGAPLSAARVEDAVLQAWWEPATFAMVKPDPASGSIRLEATRVAFDPWLVALACLVLLAEMFFVHWLCPKMNPAVASSSVVAQRGFFEENSSNDLGSTRGPGTGGTASPSSSPRDEAYAQA